MHTYQNFDDWWNEVESFSLRSERFYESVDQFSSTTYHPDLELWLRAAFEAGRSQITTK